MSGFHGVFLLLVQTQMGYFLEFKNSTRERDNSKTSFFLSSVQLITYFCNEMRYDFWWQKIITEIWEMDLNLYRQGYYKSQSGVFLAFLIHYDSMLHDSVYSTKVLKLKLFGVHCSGLWEKHLIFCWIAFRHKEMNSIFRNIVNIMHTYMRKSFPVISEKAVLLIWIHII